MSANLWFELALACTLVNELALLGRMTHKVWFVLVLACTLVNELVLLVALVSSENLNIIPDAVGTILGACYVVSRLSEVKVRVQ